MPEDEHTELVVRPRGELDIARAEVLREEWTRAVEAEQPDRFVIDLGEVTFLDSSILAAIVRVHERQRGHGRDVVVVNASRRIAKIFAITGLQDVLHVNGAGPAGD
jgi:anti-sigma B factor antagonist